jgi:hypothetical protein
LLNCVIASTTVMLIESIDAGKNEGLAFNLIFWQVCVSVVDIIILTPRPGKFIMVD